MRRILLFTSILLVACAALLISGDPRGDARLKKALRAPERNGWIPIHLEGTPAEIGFQHGYLLAPEIQDAVHAVAFEFKPSMRTKTGSSTAKPRARFSGRTSSSNTAMS